jgi:hypothetical protein
MIKRLILVAVAATLGMVAVTSASANPRLPGGSTVPCLPEDRSGIGCTPVDRHWTTGLGLLLPGEEAEVLIWQGQGKPYKQVRVKRVRIPSHQLPIAPVYNPHAPSQVHPNLSPEIHRVPGALLYEARLRLMLRR